MFKVAKYVKINSVKTFAEKCAEGRAAGKDDIVRLLSSRLRKTIFNARVGQQIWKWYTQEYFYVYEHAAYTDSAALDRFLYKFQNNEIDNNLRHNLGYKK